MEVESRWRDLGAFIRDQRHRNFAVLNLLWKGIEVTTGAQREHRYDVLAARESAVILSKQVGQFTIDRVLCDGDQLAIEDFPQIATLVQGYTAFLYRGPLWARQINRGLARGR